MGWNPFKEVRKLEHTVLGNDVVKYLDPAVYYTQKDVERNTAPLDKYLIGSPQQRSNLGGAPAVSDETVQADAKRKRNDARMKRQGSGASGSTMLTGDEEQSLEKSTLLGL